MENPLSCMLSVILVSKLQRQWEASHGTDKMILHSSNYCTASTIVPAPYHQVLVVRHAAGIL
jgi:hypothetical protein